MDLVQFVIPGRGRRVGLIQADRVLDLTCASSALATVVELASRAFQQGKRLPVVVEVLGQGRQLESLDYNTLLAADPEGKDPWLLPPVDHPDPSRVLVSGTGLTHLGSVQSRDEMHGGKAATVEPQTDSAKMFAMGLADGKPLDDQRGAAPEWFYKGNEDHHFKFSQHRRPGDLHLHFFGTSKLSYGARTWKYAPGDEVRIEAPGFSAPLVNTVAAGRPEEGRLVRVAPA